MDEWKDVFGKAPESFENRVRDTLADLKEDNMSKRYFGRKLAVGLIAAALLITGALAVGSQIGLLDYFGDELPQEAEKLINSEPDEAISLDGVEFSVGEYVYDGVDLLMVINCKAPKDTLLIALDSMPSDPVSWILPELEGDTRTIEQYAEDEGKTVLHVDAVNFCEGELVTSSQDYRQMEDGIAIISKGIAKSPEIECHVNVIHDYGAENQVKNKDSFKFTLSTDANEKVVSYSAEEMKLAGVILDSVELRHTELNVRGTIDFHLADDATDEQAENARDGLVMRIIDKDGNRWEMGIGAGSWVEDTDNGWRAVMSLEERELPDEFTLEVYNCWTKEIYGSLTLNAE